MFKKLRKQRPAVVPPSIAPTSDIDRDTEFLCLYRKLQPFTMTSLERMKALHDVCGYILSNKIAGDWVECGVWRGGSAMLMAHALHQAADPTKLYLYDTFEGMSEPTDNDLDVSGKRAAEALAQESKSDPNSVWCYSTLEEVRANLATTGLPDRQLIFCKGKVEETIPETTPDQIALLRLDTDWYESTVHELEHLYPKLVSGGVLIIDDYGHWEGCRKAVDEFLATLPFRPLLHRIDYTGRILVKP